MSIGVRLKTELLLSYNSVALIIFVILTLSKDSKIELLAEVQSVESLLDTIIYDLSSNFIPVVYFLSRFLIIYFQLS